MNTIQSIKGFNDVLPLESYKFQYVEKTITNIINSFGFLEIRTPIVEKTELFQRSIGDQTDIITKEMYSFIRNGEKSFTLRPEGTVGVARAILQNGLSGNKQKVWYNGYMFRAENPQKGRYRQFQQIGVEAYNLESTKMELELLVVASNIWKALGIDQSVSLEINSLGNAQTRIEYKKSLVEYFNLYKDKLDADSLIRLEKNPLRILDSKNEGIQDILKNAPKILDFLDNESLEKFNFIIKGLDYLKIPYTVNPRLVRGLDYYNDFVFEFITSNTGAQNTLCAGGRYDTLVEQIGGKKTPAVGFAIGIERLVLILDELELFEDKKSNDIYICTLGSTAYFEAFKLREELISKNPSLSIFINNEDLSLKNQLKKANKEGSDICLILGDNELAENKIVIKYMKLTTEQETVPFSEIISRLTA